MPTRLTEANRIRIGVDLGGTKIEALALDRHGVELQRHRVATPRFDYAQTIRAIVDVVTRLEKETGCTGTVGVAIPGTISRKTGLVKNANSTWINGRPFDHDLSGALGREVRIANDANCLAVSEATDGAGAGKRVVFAVILGTGCGGGIALDGRVHEGMNGVAGEWGHNPLPWREFHEYPGPECYCGHRGCIETWISGTGLEADYQRSTNVSLTGREIVARSLENETSALAALDRYQDRLARSLAHVINLLDPDVIVLGGGMSRVESLYQNLSPRIQSYVFGKEADASVVAAEHGDSSGVRGAAWLWPLEEARGPLKNQSAL
jgi:fructokinase